MILRDKVWEDRQLFLSRVRELSRGVWEKDLVKERRREEGKIGHEGNKIERKQTDHMEAGLPIFDEH